MCLHIQGNIQCTHVFIRATVLWNVFWLATLCWGSVRYVRGYFHCVPLLRPEKREFSPSPNKGTMYRQWRPKIGILIWPITVVLNLLLHYFCRPFSLLLFKSYTIKLLFQPVLSAWRWNLKCRELYFPYLGLIACAGHPALEETEGTADFVFLWLDLRWDYVFIPLLILDPVSVWTSQSAVISIYCINLDLRKTKESRPNMDSFNTGIHHISTFRY